MSFFLSLFLSPFLFYTSSFVLLGIYSLASLYACFFLSLFCSESVVDDVGESDEINLAQSFLPFPDLQPHLALSHLNNLFSLYLTNCLP